MGGACLQNTLLKSYHPDYWPCWGCVEFAHTIAWRCPAGSYWPLETTLAAFPPLLPSYWPAHLMSYFISSYKCRKKTKKSFISVYYSYPSYGKSCFSWEVVMFFYLGILNKYLRLALPLLFFCVLPFRDGGGCWTASFTASSQKPMLELWVSPQILLESEPQLVQELVFTDPHTELLRDVCE